MKKYKAFIVYNEFSKTKSTSLKIDRLIEEGNNLNISFDLYSHLDLTYVYKDCQDYIKEIDQTNYDFCIFLDKDKYLSKAIDHKVKMFNNFESIFVCDDKMETYQALNGLNIKTPLTIPGPLNYTNTPNSLLKDKFLKKVTDNINFPIVVKESFGSLGKQVFLANNYHELSELYVKLINKPHFYQEYISYEKGTDYRVLTVGEKVVACMQRHNSNDFRSNIALGGNGINYKLPKEVENVVIEIVKRLKLEYAGIDLVLDNDGLFKLLEVNSNAFFERIEEVSKLNIARLFLLRILECLEK